MTNEEKLSKLINIYQELSCFDHHKSRDYHYEIVWNWNYGEPYWCVQHYGYIWEIPYDETGKFGSFDDATSYFIKLVKDKIWDELCWHRENKEDGPSSGIVQSPYSLSELDSYETKVKEILS